MAGPLTYPPEIQIESTVDLPPEFVANGSDEAWVELLGVAIEAVFELPFYL